MPIPALLTVLLCSFPQIVAPAALDSWTGAIEERDGVVHVHNPAEPYLEELVLKPQPLFRIEGEGDEYLLGAVSRIECDEEGRSYLLDTQLNCVWVFDEQGNFLRSIGREGEAPGEWSRGYNMMLLPDDRLVVVQTMPPRLVQFTREGEVLDDLPIPPAEGIRVLLSTAAGGDQLVLKINAPSFDEGVQTDRVELVGLDTTGEQRCVYGESTHSSSVQSLVLGKDRDGVPEMWSLGSDGTLYTAPAHREYRIESYDRVGALQRVVHRPYEVLPLNDDDREDLKKSVYYVGMDTPAYEYASDACLRDVSGMIVRDNGEIWVESSRTRRRYGEGMLRGCEVLDPDGRLARIVRVDLDFEPGRDWPYVAGDRVYLMRDAAGMWKSQDGEGRSLAEEETEYEEIEFAIEVYSLPLACSDSAR